ncbi:peptide maturation system acyl carrier-related protein [Clostridium botulinum]|nr:peptide maturation system acyl carrier-related protein [Clostridium botulinum]
MVRQSDINSILIDIIKNNFNINFLNYSENVFDEHLLGRILQFRSMDLVYLLLFIEEKFDIVFSEEEIIEGKFSTFNKISDMIYCKLQQKIHVV